MRVVCITPEKLIARVSLRQTPIQTYTIFGWLASNVIIRFAFHLNQSNGYHPHTSFVFQSHCPRCVCDFFFLFIFRFAIPIYGLLKHFSTDFDSNRPSSVCHCQIHRNKKGKQKRERKKHTHTEHGYINELKCADCSHKRPHMVSLCAAKSFRQSTVRNFYA